MPIDKTRYPPSWPQFSKWLRWTRARCQCECVGQCGLHVGFRCREMLGQRARFARGMVRLQAAHLCDCYPICANPAHVIAMCAACHLRTDTRQHVANRKKKRNPAPPAFSPENPEPQPARSGDSTRLIRNPSQPDQEPQPPGEGGSRKASRTAEGGPRSRGGGA